ncbi:MAG: fumarylacetoacetate hydrolase family protein, partial [Chloroflexi bacterium]|nr:fumarylacetoacetate hydrolase family protein [Chloroflexota bacterium]
MKLVLYNDFQPGLLVGDRVVGISSVVGRWRRAHPEDVMFHIIEDFASYRDEIERLQQSAQGVPVGSVRLRAPIPRPRKLLCCFGNYKEGQTREPFPVDMFLKSPDAVIGPGDTVVLPRVPFRICHHEAELGVVIGRRAKDVSRADAMSAVFGYTAFMDVSPRGGVGRNPSVTMITKSFDTCAPMGPCIVTADEIGDPQNLRVRYWVDNQPRHDYSTSDLEHSIPEIIEWASTVMTLLPGDVIALGT